MSLPEEFLKTQKEKLESEKERLMSEISKLKKYPDYGDRDEDNTQEIVDYEKNLSVEDSLKQSLDEVNIALKSIETGDYGQCRKCSVEIDRELLEVMPSIDLCSKCQKK
ncbi:hypothetical protein COT78_00410 [Candidatus Berkelbacteria bacterium CG10_big_fil_rev_8_21_14_0_10_43_13]|uniref:Uncharacterized protein n=1 Tax=Candidatus Berkelbacteria bacterium CG10_big_fil_rev_8_21_14_0_10_43_13 TaxID=1974514 RepID=A0A2H0W7G5_9BACT|nr:MAG: hypothetical protein COT78_00410 [Candidatus Berkelbacteria bacterium CG10_big_fil_rev_8_21_14_0_10_43_13]